MTTVISKSQQIKNARAEVAHAATRLSQHCDWVIETLLCDDIPSFIEDGVLTRRSQELVNKIVRLREIVGKAAG